MVAKLKKTKKRASRQSLFFSLLLGVLILVVVGFLIVSNWRISQKRLELNTRVETLKREIQILENEKEKLEAQIFQTEGEEYLEREAREKFNLQKPGEEVVAVLPLEEKEGFEKEKGFWQNLLDKIKFW